MASKKGRPKKANAKHRSWRKLTIYQPDDLWAHVKKRVVDVGGDMSDLYDRAMRQFLGLPPA